ncbi:RING/U-box superfamily protein [Tasmannia lanceolata]|uniref:RING/U-box superfamily protein n=1 Tax=Tasmannia lanceolata TaxID=3420 RepID=UPI004062F777
MSISPTDVQRSASSSSIALSQKPNPNHGLLQSSQFIASHIDSPALGSTQISASESISGLSTGNSGSVASAAAYSSVSTTKVTDLRTPECKKGLVGENHGTSSHGHSPGLGGITSQYKLDQTTGSGSLHGGATNSTQRKNQMMNANHLLNFYYDPISRPPQRIPPPRRPQKIKPYNKDLFLQANFKFVVLDSGNYAIELMDPDKMLQWEDVVCVRYSTPLPVQCPICLENPLCPQITSCGHIFCFPCILRYLLMGEEDRKGDCWKKCPLCFMMISPKDLYTIYIDHVKQYHVGDRVYFTLLTRPKDSLFPSQKNQQGMDVIPYSTDGLCDSFSKFTVTSDVELSVWEAKLGLHDWLVKAESGLVEDLEQLPYVCAALEHLEQRKKCWVERQGFSGSPPLRNHGATYSNSNVCKDYSNKTQYHDSSDFLGEQFLIQSNGPNNISLEGLVTGDSTVLPPNVPEAFDSREKASSSYDEDKALQMHSNDYKDGKEKDSYSFYQAADGQHLILHPLNMKCLLHHYGSYDLLPSRIGGEILQLETVTQSEAMRRRYRFLSHFSLTTTFQLCEIDLSDFLPPKSLSPFVDEIKKRKNQRKRLAKKENEEKARAEAASMHGIPIPSDLRHSSYNDATFSIDDFEALGSPPVSSTSPPIVGDRKLFSDVTRLGFAAAHDSPSLKAEESADDSSNMDVTGEATSLTGPRNPSTLSFANILSTVKSGTEAAAKTNGIGKKGKKQSRVLLSTNGGRRY